MHLLSYWCQVALVQTRCLLALQLIIGYWQPLVTGQCNYCKSQLLHQLDPPGSLNIHPSSLWTARLFQCHRGSSSLYWLPQGKKYNRSWTGPRFIAVRVLSTFVIFYFFSFVLWLSSNNEKQINWFVFLIGVLKRSISEIWLFLSG